MDKEIRDPKLFISKSARKEYFERLNESDSPLKSLDNKEIFFLAMTVGFLNNLKEPITDRDAFFRVRNMIESEHAILNSIAIHDEGSLEILLRKKDLYKIAEEYANAGIRLLLDLVFEGGYGLFSRQLEERLIDELSNIAFD